MSERATRTASSTSIIVRLTLLATFLVFCGRLYALQIVRGATYQEQADVNRLRQIDLYAPRGVIYDRNGEILARNRPSFVIAVIPVDLPADDLTTLVDEQRIALERLLAVLGADTDAEMAIRIAEVMFLHLGREDFKNTVESAGITLSFRLVNLETLQKDEEGREILVEEPTLIPDLSEPLPVGGLLALLERAVALGSQGSSYKPISVLDLVDRELAFQVAEETYQLRGVHVLQKPVREYPFRELAGHILGFLGPIPKLAADDYKARGYEDPNESVGLNGLEYTYQDELRGLPGQKTGRSGHTGPGESSDKHSAGTRTRTEPEFESGYQFARGDEQRPRLPIGKNRRAARRCLGYGSTQWGHAGVGQPAQLRQ